MKNFVDQLKGQYVGTPTYQYGQIVESLKDTSKHIRLDLTWEIEPNKWRLQEGLDKPAFFRFLRLVVGTYPFKWRISPSFWATFYLERFWPTQKKIQEMYFKKFFAPN